MIGFYAANVCRAALQQVCVGVGYGSLIVVLEVLTDPGADV